MHQRIAPSNNSTITASQQQQQQRQVVTPPPISPISGKRIRKVVLVPNSSKIPSSPPELKLHHSLDIWSQVRMKRRFVLGVLLFGVVPLCLRSVFYGVAEFPFDLMGEVAVNSDDSETLRVPNVLLMGAQETGTVDTANWILKHANVCRPKQPADGVPMREVHFFDKDERFLHKVPYYANHYRHCHSSQNVILDATPETLQHSHRVRAIYNQLGGTYAQDLKIIMILRNPMARQVARYKKLAQLAASDPDSQLQEMFDSKGKLMSFEDYTKTWTLPKLKSSASFYSKWIRRWLDHFDRGQFLFLNYEELLENPRSVMERLVDFMDLKKPSKRHLKSSNGIIEQEVNDYDEGETQLPCGIHNELIEAFQKNNKELYRLLQESKGPKEEEPFPQFKMSRDCIPDQEETGMEPKSLRASKQDAQTAKKRTGKSQNSIQQGPDTGKPGKSGKVVVLPKHSDKRTTVFFAAHHKTGTTLSQLVANRLAEQDLIHFDPQEQVNERVLNQDANGNAIQCVGTENKQQLRSYLHWPTWMIDKLWSQCVETWWENWPSLKSRTDQLIENKCDEGQVNMLTGALYEAACFNDYLVVHFVRSPIDIMLSSYRYTRLGEEAWMHDKLENHPRFTPSLCGEHSCQHMSINEAVNKLPLCQGLILEMKLVSLEIVKQMLVGATLARADPSHHITVNLSELMESTEVFNTAWTNSLETMFPKKSQEEIEQILESLQEFDTNKDPERKAKQNEAETMDQMECLFQDAEVRLMLNDPLVKQIVSATKRN